MTTRSRYMSGVQVFWDDALNHEIVHAMTPIQYREDFLGAGKQAVPAAGASENGADWVKKIVGAGPPTVAGVADFAGGAIACALTATSEKQDAVLYHDDHRGFDISAGLLWEARVALSVLPSAAAVQAVWGLASNWIDGPDNNTCYAQFGALANGDVLCRSFDGVTTKSVASGVTLLTTDMPTFRINALDPTALTFHINGVQVGDTVNFAASGSLAILQPYFAMYKASGTGVGTMRAESCKIFGKRT